MSGANGPVDTLPSTADFVVIGGGIVGLTTALELRKRYPSEVIVVLEKELQFGAHASGRNSGVLHAGFYYSADSLKARLCRDGNQRMRTWCEEHEIKTRNCGKLVVAQNASELAGLSELAARAKRNHVPIELISADDAKRIEPRAITHERALYAPTTTAVAPHTVILALVEEAQRQGIVLAADTAWLSHNKHVITTTRGNIEAGYLINAAGLQAVRIARVYGLAERYRMLPFKGCYLYGSKEAPALNVHIYPVPNLEMPFLGVHFTVTVDGRSKIGPTAMPALWLENYGRFGRKGFFERFSLRELLSITTTEFSLLMTNAQFRRHAWREPQKAFTSRLIREAQGMLEGVDPRHFTEWGRPGIRAQLLDTAKGELVMDFCFEKDEHSLHVLNAVSPAFTCSLPFAELLVDNIETLP